MSAAALGAALVADAPSNYQLQQHATRPSAHPAAALSGGSMQSAQAGPSTPAAAATERAQQQEQQQQQQQQQRSLMRRSASAPALRAACAPHAPHAPRCACDAAHACGCLEVYVASRGFTEFGGPLFKRMSPEVRQSLVDMGVCHFLTVFKTPDGRLIQFDFGPQGGDVEKADGPLGAVLRAARRRRLQQEQEQPAGGAGAGGMRPSPSAPALELALAAAAASEGEGGGGSGCGWDGGTQGAPQHQLQQQQQQRGLNGEIRERKLDALPAAHMYVGRTSLTLDDVRMYNLGRAKQYRLHQNDCRCVGSGWGRVVGCGLVVELEGCGAC